MGGKNKGASREGAEARAKHLQQIAAHKRAVKLAKDLMSLYRLTASFYGATKRLWWLEVRSQELDKKTGEPPTRSASDQSFDDLPERMCEHPNVPVIVTSVRKLGLPMPHDDPSAKVIRVCETYKACTNVRCSQPLLRACTPYFREDARQKDGLSKWCAGCRDQANKCRVRRSYATQPERERQKRYDATDAAHLKRKLREANRIAKATAERRELEALRAFFKDVTAVARAPAAAGSLGEVVLRMAAKLSLPSTAIAEGA